MVKLLDLAGAAVAFAVGIYAQNSSESDYVPQTEAIVGGFPAPSPITWLATIKLKTRGGDTLTSFCAGSLIDPYWILTAAHCRIDMLLYSNGGDPAFFQVWVGGLHSNDPDEFSISDVVEFVSHPGYDPNVKLNDVALMKLTTPIYDRALAAPSRGGMIEDVGTMGEVSGWGRTDPDDSYHPIDLQTVSLPQVSLEQCTLAYKFYAVTVDDTQVCAGYLSGGQDACQGDSGGPYWVVDEAGIQRVVGIVSYGIGCAQPGLYGIYTRVNSFNSWIVSYLSGGVQTRADTYVYAAEEDDANRDYSYNPDANDFSRAEASTSDSSVLSVGAIVGIAVGCVAVVGIFVGGAVFVVKRKKQISTPNSNTSAQLRESSVGVRENESSTSVTDVSGRSNDKTLFV